MQCAYLLGYCFSLISESTNPDAPQQWNEMPPPPAKEDSKDTIEKDTVKKEESSTDGISGSSSDRKSSTTEGGELLGNKYSSLSLVFRKQEAVVSEIAESISLQFMAQAVHALVETTGFTSSVCTHTLFYGTARLYIMHTSL